MKGINKSIDYAHYPREKYSNFHWRSKSINNCNFLIFL